MKRKLFLLQLMIPIAIMSASCISGYMPVDHDKKHTGRAIKKMQVHGVNIDMMLGRQRNGDIYVTLSVLNIIRSNPVKLSNVKVLLTGVSGPLENYTLQRIDVHHTSSHSGLTTLVKTIDKTAITGSADFDLSDDGFFTIAYYFSASRLDMHPKKLAADVEGTVASANGRQAFHESVVFRKYQHFSLYH